MKRHCGLIVKSPAVAIVILRVVCDAPGAGEQVAVVCVEAAAVAVVIDQVVVAPAAAVAISASCYLGGRRQQLHQLQHHSPHYGRALGPVPEEHYCQNGRNSFVWADFVTVAAKRVAQLLYFPTRRRTQQGSQIAGEIVSAAKLGRSNIQKTKAVLYLLPVQEKDQNACLVCSAPGFLIAFAPSSVLTVVPGTDGLVCLVASAEAAAHEQAIPKAFGRTGSVAALGSSAFEGLHGSRVANLAQREVEVVSAIQHPHWVAVGSEQAGLEVAVPAAHPTPWPDYDHQIHEAPEPVPWCTSCRS